MKQTAPAEIARMLGDTPVYRNDKNTLPLQAADLYAWWVRKWEREGINWRETMPFPWEKQKKINRLGMSIREADFRKGFARGLMILAENESELSYARTLLHS
jgi:hypothetical protein